MKRILIIGGILLLVLGTGVAYTRGNGNDAGASESEPQFATIQRGPLRVVVEATGRVVPEQEVEIKCKASGEVTELTCDVSDRVENGRILARLDPEDEERSVQRATVALAVSQARQKQARLSLQMAQQELATERTRVDAALESARTRLTETQERLARSEQLLDQELVSQEAVDAARTAFVQAKAELANARTREADLKTLETRLESLKADIEIADAAVQTDRLALEDAKQRLEDTTVTAPIDGIVASRFVQVGQIIASGINNIGGGTPIMNLVDLSRIYVLVAVDESDIGRISEGQRASITVDAYPDMIFPGTVVRVATKGVNTSNVVTFEVKVEVHGPQRRLLKPEMLANVDITAVDAKDVLLVPVNALQRRRGERFVEVRKADGSLESRAVVVGPTDGEMAQAVEGLSEGEEVKVGDGTRQSRWRRDEQDKRRGPFGR